MPGCAEYGEEWSAGCGVQLRRDAGWECREGCGVKRGARCGAKRGAGCGAKRGAGGEGGVEGGVEDNAVRGGAGRDGKRQKWRAKSLRTPFYQYSIYNQKDVLIIVLIILSHPLRSGHSHFHLEQ